jgi:pyrroline-5-carboxylate reductase
MLYNALVEAGFNEDQALDFVAKMMIGVMKK